MLPLVVTFPLLSGYAFSGLIRALGYKGKIIQIYSLLVGTFIVSPLIHYFIFQLTHDLVSTILLGLMYLATFSILRGFKYAPDWGLHKQPNGKWENGFKYEYRLFPGM